MGLCHAHWSHACTYTTHFLTYPPQITVLSENHTHSYQKCHTGILCASYTADHSFCSSAPPEVHRFHFVLGSSSPSVSFCSLSCTATARTSLTFSLGIPLTLLPSFQWRLSSDRSSTLPIFRLKQHTTDKGKTVRLKPNPMSHWHRTENMPVCLRAARV